MEATGRDQAEQTNVVVGFDGNGESCDALAFGRLVADAVRAELIVAAVYPARGAESTESRRDFFRRVFARAAHELGERWFTGGEMVDSPARGLHMLADAEGASLVVVGSTHRGRFGQVFPGSVGNQLLSGTPCPVVVVPRGFVDRPQVATIGVAYNESGESDRALTYGGRLATLLGSALRVITVGPRYGPLDLLFESSAEARERLEERMEHGLAKLPPEVVATGIVREGDPAPELAAASREVDLLIVGSRSYGPLRSVLLGSVSADLFRTAESAVLAIPRGFPVPAAIEGLAASLSGATT